MTDFWFATLLIAAYFVVGALLKAVLVYFEDEDAPPVMLMWPLLLLFGFGYGVYCALNAPAKMAERLRERRKQREKELANAERDVAQLLGEKGS